MGYKLKSNTSNQTSNTKQRPQINTEQFRNSYTYIYIGQFIFMTIWLIMMFSSLAFFTPYIFVYILSVIACVFNILQKAETSSTSKQAHNKAIITFATIFTILVTLANHELWLGVSGLINLNLDGHSFDLIIFLIILIGGFSCAYHINLYIANNLNKLTLKENNSRVPAWGVFLISFALISLVNLLVLFLCKYPGSMSPDSIDQVTTIIKDEYNNFSPYYHTLLIRLGIFIGTTFFGDINAGIACFTVMQILFMAAIFAYSIYTLYQEKISKVILILVLCFTILMPYHIMYSFLVWKNVFFGGFCLLFCTSFYRCYKKIGINIINYILLLLSSVGVCLFVSNGSYAFFIFTVACCFLLFKNNKKLLFVIVGSLLLGLFLKYPMLNMLNVKQYAVTTPFSIPFQQVGQAITDHNDLTDEEREVVENYIDPDQVSSLYQPGLSDNLIFKFKETYKDYYTEHKAESLQTYLSIGLRHPISYLKAFIDQTKGYYNSGYQYWYYTDGIYKNTYGIERQVANPGLNNSLMSYITSFNNEPLCLFKSIGFFTWICLLVLYIGTIKRNKAIIIPAALNLAVILSVCLSTPVFTETRYAYNVFCCAPFLLCISFSPTNQIDYTQKIKNNQANQRTNYIKEK